MSPEFGRHKALLGRAAERTQMSGVGGFFHSASKGVGYDSGPRPDGTRANAAALTIQRLARGHAGRKVAATEAKREAAALNIQAHVRGNAGRLAATEAKRAQSATKIQAMVRGAQLRNNPEPHKRQGAIAKAEAWAASPQRRVDMNQVRAELGHGKADTTYYGQKGLESTHIRAMLNDPRLQNDYKLNRETDRMQGPAKYAALLSEQVSTRAKSLGQASGAIGPDAGQNVQSRFNNANKYKNEGTLHWVGRKVYEGLSSAAGMAASYLPGLRTASSAATVVNEHSKASQFDQISKRDDASAFTSAIAAGAKEDATRKRSDAIVATGKNLAKDLGSIATLGSSEALSQAENVLNRNVTLGNMGLQGYRMATDKSEEGRLAASVDVRSATHAEVDSANDHLLALPKKDHLVANALIKHMAIDMSGPSGAMEADSSRFKKLMSDPANPGAADNAFKARTGAHDLPSRSGIRSEIFLNVDLQRGRVESGASLSLRDQVQNKFKSKEERKPEPVLVEHTLKPSEVSRMAKLERHRTAQVEHMGGAVGSLSKVQSQTATGLASRKAGSLAKSVGKAVTQTLSQPARSVS